MSSPAARAHITAQARLRALAEHGVTAAWNGLSGYDEEDVERFLTRALPVVSAAQLQSVALTDAFLAMAVGRSPLGVGGEHLTGAAVRGGTEPEEVYRRPFVTVWSALKAGSQWDNAVAAGLARVTASAAVDVQLAMRSTLREIGEADDAITGYERVPDGGACDLCLMASTQLYRVSVLQPIHNRCGCGVDVLRATDDRLDDGRWFRGGVINRGTYDDLKQSARAGILSLEQGARRAEQRAEANRQRAIAERDPERREQLEQRSVEQDRLARDYRAQLAGRRTADEGITVEVRDHGELGPVLVNGDHSFAQL
jgi:hypothetical protein